VKPKPKQEKLPQKAKANGNFFNRFIAKTSNVIELHQKARQKPVI
jgi:hypothetical protein